MARILLQDLQQNEVINNIQLKNKKSSLFNENINFKMICCFPDETVVFPLFTVMDSKVSFTPTITHKVFDLL